MRALPLIAHHADFLIVRAQHRKGKSLTAETISIERATSDYLSVSRRAHLYGHKQYDQAEQRAWEQLQEAIARAAEESEHGVDAERRPERAGA